MKENRNTANQGAVSGRRFEPRSLIGIPSMCRSIKRLNNPGQRATEDELSGAALQFVRKISGYHKPSRTNQEAFDRAVLEISESSQRLLDAINRARGQRPRSSDSSREASDKAASARTASP